MNAVRTSLHRSLSGTATVVLRIVALALKEFLALLKDKRSRTVIIIPPLLQLLVFGYAATYDLNDVPFAVFNEDPGLASRELVQRVAASSAFRPVAELRHDSEIAPLINSRRAVMILRIGPDFSADLVAGRSGAVQVIVDGRNSNTALIVVGYIRRIAADFTADLPVRKASEPPVALVPRAWFNPNLESRWFVVPGIVGLLTLVVTILVTGLSVAREREAGTFDQLLLTPLSPSEILVGKALPAFVIGLAEASFIILVAVAWFGVPLRGSLPALYAGLVLFLLSAIGVGLMISSLAVTQQQGLLGAFLFLVPAVILSGFATPIANMPTPVQILTYANPMRYFLIVLRSVFLKGAVCADLMHQYWPMAVIGILNLVAAGQLFRRRMY